MLKFLSALGLCLLICLSASAQTGIIKGIVTDADTNEPLIGVNVVLEGSTTGAATGLDGDYAINVEEGEYAIVVSYVSYFDKKVENVLVKAGETTVLDIQLGEETQLLEQATVSARANRESSNIQMLERKKSEMLVQNIGAQELSKKGASDAADGLKKVAGLSVVGGKYVVVRGMDDRYNNATLNGLPIASPDPDRKVLPLDIFPSDVIQSMSVVKAFSPKLYADFSGGNIDIRTKQYPDEHTLKIGVSSTLNTATTFRDFGYYDGRSAVFNFMNSGNKRNADLVQELFDEGNTTDYDAAHPFEHNLNPLNKTALPGFGGDLLYGNRIILDGKNGKPLEIGYMLTGAYDESYTQQEGTLRQLNVQNSLIFNYDYEQYTQNANLSSLGNMYLKFGGRHTLNANMLYTGIAENMMRETWGSHFDYSSNLFTRRYQSSKEQLIVGQLTGKHDLSNERWGMEWGVSFNNAKANEPDRRQLIYLYDKDAPQNGYYFNQIDRVDNYRQFLDLNEKEYAGGFGTQYVSKETLGENKRFTLDFGVQGKYKNRNFDFRRFVYDFTNFNAAFPDGSDHTRPDDFLNDQTEAQDIFDIEEVDNPASAYEVRLAIAANYLVAGYQLSPRLRLSAGLRAEYSNQQIEFRDQIQPVNLLNIKRKGFDFFPTLGLKWEVKANHIFRTDLSRTMSRPGFKEVAPFEDIEQFSGNKQRGEPNLENGYNYNADIRYEIYPNAGDLLSVSAFGKYLHQPVESVLIAAASGRTETYINANGGAYIAGVEVEAVMKLQNYLSTPVLRDLQLGLNATGMYSRINIEDGTSSSGVSIVQTNNSRPLQGASPFLINLDLTYEKQLEKVKTTATLAYNVFGKRISSVGIFGLDDTYEMPVNTLNFIWSNNFNNGLGITFSAKNILNPIVEQQQAGIQLDGYRRGTDLGIGISYTFK